MSLRGCRCIALIHPFASEPSGSGWSYCSPFHRRMFWKQVTLQGWRLGCVAPFGCGSIVWARTRDDGYAFPGRRECQAHVESSTTSWFFEAGRVVSRGGHVGSKRPLCCHSPGSAWGAYKIVEGTFHCPKQISELRPPHHSRWWSRFGVHGHSLGGAVCGHATVSNSRYHSAGWSVSPLTDLFFTHQI